MPLKGLPTATSGNQPNRFYLTPGAGRPPARYRTEGHPLGRNNQKPAGPAPPSDEGFPEAPDRCTHTWCDLAGPGYPKPSDCVGVHFTGADPHDLLNARHPDFSVTDLAGLGSVRDELNNTFEVSVIND